MSTMLKPSKPLSIGLVIAGLSIFFITSMMIRSAGVSSAATGQGQELLGWGNIAIHITGVGLMGMATGYLFRAKHRFFGFLTGVVVFGTALLSMYNLIGFVASERTSLAKAREAQAKLQDDRSKAQLEADRKRLALADELTRSQMKWIQGTKGKNQADMAEQGTKLIQDVRKSDVTISDAPKTELIMRPDSGVDLISNATGVNKDLIELISSVYQMLLMIMMESIIWPLAAFFWPSKEATAAIALASAIPPIPIENRGGNQRLLPAPKTREPKVITVRTEPSAEWRSLLDAIDFPPAGARHKGPLRPRLDPETQALRFVCWAGAYDERGDFLSAALDSVYEDFLSVDHREETALRQVKPALEAIKGKVASKRYVTGVGTTWHLQPPSLEKMKLLLEKAKVIDTQAPTTSVTPEVAVEADDPSDKKSVVAFPAFWRKQATGLH